MTKSFFRMGDDANTPDALEVSALRLMRDPDMPVPIHAINAMSYGAKKRLYRPLLSPALLTRFGINPINWKGPHGDRHVRLVAEPGSSNVKIAVRAHPDDTDPFAYVELADTSFNTIEVVLLVLNDPTSERFQTDYTVEGWRTLFGTVSRNLAEEERAMKAGLAPAQIRKGLRASGVALQHLESFLAMLGHGAFFVEPLTYADAWLFERRGFGYVKGQKRMTEIDDAFAPGGALYHALDKSSPFRQPELANSVRGRAWAIQDGVLETIGQKWDNFRLVKHLGVHAGINTYPDAVY